jgi:hypothetical protein
LCEQFLGLRAFASQANHQRNIEFGEIAAGLGALIF